MSSKTQTVTDKPLMTIYGNKIEIRVTFKFKTGYYLKLWSTGKMVKVCHI